MEVQIRDQRGQTFTFLLAVLSSSLSSIWPAQQGLRVSRWSTGSDRQREAKLSLGWKQNPWEAASLLGQYGSNHLHTVTPKFKKERERETRGRNITLKNHPISDSSNWPLVSSQRVNKTKSAETNGLGHTDRFYAGIPAAALLTKIHIHTLFLNVYNPKFTIQNAKWTLLDVFLREDGKGKRLKNFVLRTKTNYIKIWVLT